MKEYKKKILKKTKEVFIKKYSNIFLFPKIKKIIINTSIGLKGNNKKYTKDIIKDFENITCQKPKVIKSKKSISNFGLKKGIINAIKITIRNNNMYNFINKLINISIPRIKDFRGFKNKNVDYYGNFNYGIEDYNIFPEIFTKKYNDNNNSTGMNINIIIKSKERKDSIKLLKIIGFPFK